MLHSLNDILTFSTSLSTTLLSPILDIVAWIGLKRVINGLVPFSFFKNGFSAKMRASKGSSCTNPAAIDYVYDCACTILYMTVLGKLKWWKHSIKPATFGSGSAFFTFSTTSRILIGRLGSVHGLNRYSVFCTSSFRERNHLLCRDLSMCRMVSCGTDV